MTYRRNKKKPRYRANQTVSGAVAQRTGARLAKLGNVTGVNGADGYTGQEARLVKKARQHQKTLKSTTAADPVTERTGARLAALGGSVKGVDGTDGYTKAEARYVRRARRRQKARKLMKNYVAAKGGDTSGY